LGINGVLDPSDFGSFTTKALVVDNSDIIKLNANLPLAYQGAINLDNNDGAIIIEPNDYNGVGENYVIVGAQILVSNQNLTGTGIDLNTTAANGGASTGAQAFETGENGSEPVKISDIGFVTTNTSTPDVDLHFNVAVVDADGDATPTQTLDVHVEGGNTFTGTADAESIQGSAGADIINGGGGNDILLGGAGADKFVLDNVTSVDRIVDYQATEIIDLTALLNVAVGTNLVTDGYINIVDGGATDTLQIDLNGSSGGANFVDIATISYSGGVTQLVLQYLENGVQQTQNVTAGP